MEEYILQECIKLICGIFKNNEIPQLNCMYYNGVLIIEYMDTLLYTVPCSNVMIDNIYHLFKVEVNEDKTYSRVFINNNEILNKMIIYYNDYFAAGRYTLLYKMDNMQDDPEYSKLLMLKAAQGMKFFKPFIADDKNAVYIPVFSGLPNISKSDRLGIEIYKDNVITYHNVVVYNIYRSKIKKEYKIYFRILDLKRN